MPYRFEIVLGAKRYIELNWKTDLRVGILVMLRIFLPILIKSIVIGAISAAIGITTNVVRSDGIPVVTDIPYEIFAPCKDSEAVSEAVSTDELPNMGGDAVIYVDARPEEMFDLEHVDGAINVPYSALFGSSDEDIAKVAKAAESGKAAKVIVYGAYADPASPDEKVDFGKPLAEQLIEAGIKGVRHVEGGLEALNKTGIKTVKGARGAQ
jgi:rhodanese-related sulfurtransferase